MLKACEIPARDGEVVLLHPLVDCSKHVSCCLVQLEQVACQRELGIDNAKLNVNGGAIAIGHPLGCSGARLATTLIHQMARTGASRGIASLCVGVGQGLATVFERE